jgi:ArsR family transcriptional regulator, arsenate/arsenite/antimonite-responsive transcriptional repressor
MDKYRALAALAALAQPTRLDAFRRLIAAHPDAIPAGEIARACGVPHNTMSTHLAALARAGLVDVRRAGRSMNYSVDLAGFRALITFLTRDCCRGRPEICAPLLADLSDPCAVPARRSEKANA